MNKDFDLLQVCVVGFIGQHDFRDSAVIAGKLRAQMEKLHTPGLRMLALCPLTGPADLIFANEALGLGFPLVIALTDTREELRKKFSEIDRAEFDRILVRASLVEPLTLDAQPDVTTRLGQKLVDEADVLLAVSHDSGPPDGACAEVISYATRRGRQVICLWDDGKEITTEDAKSEPCSVERMMSMEEITNILGDPPPHPPIPDGLLKIFHFCDKHATHVGPSVRGYVVSIVLANGVASIAGSVATSFPHTGGWALLLTITKIIFILGAIYGAYILKKKQARRRWLELRLKAEVCRSAIATWNFPVAIEPVSADEAPDLRRLLQVVRYYRATRHPTAPLNLKEFKAAYGARLIEQYKYFDGQANAAISASAAVTRASLIFSWAAFAFSAAALILQLSPYRDWPKDHMGFNFWLVMVPIVAPQIVNGLVAWQTVESVGRKRARFVEMRTAVHQALVDLIHCHSWPTVQAVVLRAEKYLLSEVLEWHSFFTYSG